MSSSQSTSPAGGADRLSARAWGALLVLCGALFLDALDVSMIGVALPSIRTDLDISTSSLQWVVSAYVLGYGGFLLLGGRAADLLGRRRMFLSRSASSSSRRPSAACRRRAAAHRHPLHQGRLRGLHGARRPVDHHDDVRRGARPQPRALDLHGDRRHRFSLGLVFGGAADRARLALGVLPAGARRADHAAGGDRLVPDRARARLARSFDVAGASP
jgi:hypothetical protein